MKNTFPKHALLTGDIKTMKQFLFGLSLVFAFGFCSLVQADNTSEVILGTFRDTSVGQASQWMVKYLGGPNVNTGVKDIYGDYVFTPDENFNWAGQRSYFPNGLLNMEAGSGYLVAKAVDPYWIGYEWKEDYDWITYGMTPSGEVSPYNHNGYFSYATMINDTFSSNPSVTFNALKIAITADDHIHAIIINGIQMNVPGFPQEHDHFGWVTEYTNIMLTDIANWNVNGLNMIEFIVHNNNSNNYGDGTSDWANVPNATGFSAKIQAAYLSETDPGIGGGGGGVPEPATLLLWTLGGIGFASSSFARKRRLKKLATT